MSRIDRQAQRALRESTISVRPIPNHARFEEQEPEKGVEIQNSTNTRSPFQALMSKRESVAAIDSSISGKPAN